MKIKLNKQVGDTSLQFEIKEGNVKNAMFLAGGIANIPTECGECGSTNVSLSSNVGENEEGSFEYVKVRCKECGATSTMGSYQKQNGIFWKQFEKYQPKEGDNSRKAPQGQ